MNKQKYHEIIPEEKSIKTFDYMHSLRKEIHNQLSDLMDKEKQNVFQLINFVGISIDRLVDGNEKKEKTFLSFANLMKKVWEGKKVYSNDNYESSAIELINKLKELREKGFYQARYIFSDLQELFYWLYQDVSRRWKILSLDKLKNIRIGTSKGVANMYFYLLFPNLKKKEVENLSLKCGLAVKTADDIIDWYEDIKVGLINIPKEEIKNLGGVTIRDNHIEYVCKEELALDIDYIKGEFKTIEYLYKEANEQLKKTVPENTARGLLEKLMNSWLLEFKEKYPLAG